MSNEKDQVTTNEIMEFLQEHMMTRAEIDGKFVAIDKRFVAIDERFVAIDERFVAIEKKLTQTKLEILDGVDDKLANLKGDLVILMRKEDKKVDHLIKLLQDKSVITKQDASALLDIRPFPQSVV